MPPFCSALAWSACADSLVRKGVESVNEGGACVDFDGDSPTQLECGALVAENVRFCWGASAVF